MTNLFTGTKTKTITMWPSHRRHFKDNLQFQPICQGHSFIFQFSQYFPEDSASKVSLKHVVQLVASELPENSALSDIAGRDNTQ